MGFKNLIKDIASAGKKNTDILGCLKVPLKVTLLLNGSILI